MPTTTKEQAIIDRQQYIKRAKITFAGDYARVTSQTDTSRTYPVRVIDGKAQRCECDDFYYRGRKTGIACKHMEAVDLRIEKDAAKAARKAAKAAKSAEIVASLQVAEGVKIRKTRGQNRLVVVAKPAEIVEPEQPVEVAAVPADVVKVEQPIEAPTLRQTPRVETRKLQIALSKPIPPLVIRGNLSSNRGFSLLR